MELFSLSLRGPNPSCTSVWLIFYFAPPGTGSQLIANSLRFDFSRSLVYKSSAYSHYFQGSSGWTYRLLN